MCSNQLLNPMAVAGDISSDTTQSRRSQEEPRAKGRSLSVPRLSQNIVKTKNSVNFALPGPLLGILCVELASAVTVERTKTRILRFDDTGIRDTK